MSGPDKKKLDKMIWQLREGWGESTRIEAARDLGWIGTQAADEAEIIEEQRKLFVEESKLISLPDYPNQPSIRSELEATNNFGVCSLIK